MFCFFINKLVQNLYLYGTFRPTVSNLIIRALTNLNVRPIKTIKEFAAAKVISIIVFN